VQDDGYLAILKGALSLTLRSAPHVSQQVFVAPGG
jgi:hypothetical protein